MTHLESIPSTIYQTLVEDSSICIESQIGDGVVLLCKLASLLSKRVSWAQAVIKKGLFVYSWLKNKAELANMIFRTV